MQSKVYNKGYVIVCIWTDASRCPRSDLYVLLKQPVGIHYLPFSVALRSPSPILDYATYAWTDMVNYPLPLVSFDLSPSRASFFIILFFSL